MESILVVTGTLLIVAGLVFFLGAAVGIWRFPDFYTKMHAAGKGDTLSSLLVVLGFAIALSSKIEFNSEWLLESKNWGTILVPVKLLAICVFIMITSPTSTHALMDSGWEDDCEPTLKDEKSNALKEDENL